MSTFPPLYLNENVPLRLVDILSEIGIYAVHTVEVGNQGISDEAQLQYAVNRGCILVTHNRKDFRELHKRWLKEKRHHYGIIVMKHDEPERLAMRIKLFFEEMYHKLTPPFCVSPPPV